MKELIDEKQILICTQNFILKCKQLSNIMLNKGVFPACAVPQTARKLAMGLPP